MLQPQIIISVIDNTSVKSVKCIKVHKSINKAYKKKSGTFFKGIVMTTKKSNKIKINPIKYKKGNLVTCFYVQSKKEVERKKTGIYLKSIIKNGAVVVDTKTKIPLASRFEGYFPIYFKLYIQKQFLFLTKSFL